MYPAARSRRDRIRAQLADLKMPGALEAIDDVLIRYGRTASAADRAVLVELRRFLAVNHATGTLPSGPKSIGRMACGPYRLGGRSRTGSTGCRCVAAHWRFWTRHGRSWREPARSCFPIGSVSSSRRSNCAGCSGSTGSRPCHTGFARASGLGGRRDGSSPRGHQGSLGARRPEQG